MGKFENLITRVIKTKSDDKSRYFLFILDIIDWEITFSGKKQISKVGDRSWGQPEGSLFNSYNTEV